MDYTRGIGTGGYEPMYELTTVPVNDSPSRPHGEQDHRRVTELSLLVHDFSTEPTANEVIGPLVRKPSYINDHMVH